MKTNVMTAAPVDAAARKAVQPVICYPVETLPRPDLSAYRALRDDLTLVETVVVPPTNFYLANGACIVPVTAGSDLDKALDAVQSVLPSHEVVGVPGTVLAYGGGGVHCITQQVPAVGLAAT